MSTIDRSARPLKPTLASTRTAASKTPLAPRIAGGSVGANTSAPNRPAAPRTAGRAPLLSPSLRAQETPGKEGLGSHNVTPRSSTRTSRVGVGSGRSSPAVDDTPSDIRSRNGLSSGSTVTGRSAVGEIGLTPTMGMSTRSRKSRPNSIVSDTRPKIARSPPLVRSPGLVDGVPSGSRDRFENRFFHASDAKKQEPSAKKPGVKKPSTFFYADGHQDDTTAPPKATSPGLPGSSGRHHSGTGVAVNVKDVRDPKKPPMPSPALGQPSTNFSYFPPTIPLSPLRSPSPSKENIHLSYRKGASQICGVRPQPRATPSVPDLVSRVDAPEVRRPSRTLVHRKSSSLSSMTSGSEPMRRRSYTALNEALVSSPLTHETSHATSPSVNIPSIDTSLASPIAIGSPPETALSPTRTVTQLAADARRERKVLDLEISNSSLLAINASLERELRRQKVELKRFRRLSRAGRLSLATFNMPGRLSGDLETLGEDDDDGIDDMPTGWYDVDMSESEDDSLVSGSGSRSPSISSDRLAKDEKRLKVDLERHRELLVQSQAMNQSLKRCMYATDEMIRNGRKALEYHIRVSDVKLGGRILTGEEDDEDLTQDIIVNDDEFAGTAADGMENAKGLLDVWRGVGQSDFNGSEGDRDSGIEVDKPYGFVSQRHSNATDTTTDSGRPPEQST